MTFEDSKIQRRHGYETACDDFTFFREIKALNYIIIGTREFPLKIYTLHAYL